MIQNKIRQTITDIDKKLKFSILDENYIYIPYLLDTNYGKQAIEVNVYTPDDNNYDFMMIFTICNIISIEETNEDTLVTIYDKLHLLNDELAGIKLVPQYNEEYIYITARIDIYDASSCDISVVLRNSLDRILKNTIIVRDVIEETMIDPIEQSNISCDIPGYTANPTLRGTQLSFDMFDDMFPDDEEYYFD